MTNSSLRFAVGLILVITTGVLAQRGPSAVESWQVSQRANVEVQTTNLAAWKVASRTAGEFTIDSERTLPCRPGDTFSVNINIRVDLNTKALPELACFDAAGKEIPGPSAFD